MISYEMKYSIVNHINREFKSKATANIESMETHKRLSNNLPPNYPLFFVSFRNFVREIREILHCAVTTMFSNLFHLNFILVSTISCFTCVFNSRTLFSVSVIIVVHCN